MLLRLGNAGNVTAQFADVGDEVGPLLGAEDNVQSTHACVWDIEREYRRRLSRLR